MERDLNTQKWYRHRLTGKVGRYWPALGDNDPNLEEVPEGTKRLLFPEFRYRPSADAAVVEIPAVPEPPKEESGEGRSSTTKKRSK